MAIYWPTPDFKGRTFKLCVLTRWNFNFCVRSSPLGGTCWLKELFFRISIMWTRKKKKQITDIIYIVIVNEKKKYRSIFLCFYCPARWVARYRHLNEIFIFFDLPPNYNADRYVTSYILPVSIEAILNINTCYLCQQTASLWEQMLLVKVHLIQADGFIQYVFVLIRNRSLSSFLLKFSKKKIKGWNLHKSFLWNIHGVVKETEGHIQG